ncbi:MAG: ATP-binding protein [Chthoniobacterales bacterium]
MTAREEHLLSLVERPRESMAVELKDWFDPRDPQGIAKIVRTLLALRNQNGGFLVIGVNNDTLQRTKSPYTEDELGEIFHSDAMQYLASRYASQSFEVTVDLQRFDGGIFPVISVAGGIVTPVACKADLKTEDGTTLLRAGDVFVRTLNSNGTVSSARASWKDFEPLTARCFENREADHARFLTKFFAGLAPDTLKSVVNVLTVGSQTSTSDTLPTQKKILEYGVERFRQILEERKIDVASIGFWDVALHIEGALSGYQPNSKFLELLRNSNPDLTGWPIWLDSSPFADPAARPYVFDDKWEAFIYDVPQDTFGHWGELDFMIFDPRGDFFLRRALQDDLGSSYRPQTSGKTIEPFIAILRTAEAIAVGQAFARALGCSDDHTALHFIFRWTGLKGREMSAWSSPARRFLTGGPSHQGEVSSSVSVPLSANREIIINATHSAILPLSRLFGGYEIKEPVVRDFVTRLLDRKL